MNSLDKSDPKYSDYIQRNMLVLTQSGVYISCFFENLALHIQRESLYLYNKYKELSVKMSPTKTRHASYQNAFEEHSLLYYGFSMST